MKHSVIAAITGILCLASYVAAQKGALPEKAGLKIGETAPAFKLKDQTGKPRTLDDFTRDVDYVAIVFHRSANW